jgi:hypothetical protein
MLNLTTLVYSQHNRLFWLSPVSVTKALEVQNPLESQMKSTPRHCERSEAISLTHVMWKASLCMDFI